MTLRMSSQKITLYIPTKRDGQDITERLAAVAKAKEKSLNCVLVEAILQFLDGKDLAE
jgi:predicted transcriptional regulator